jgi:hypothetical protein
VQLTLAGSQLSQAAISALQDQVKKTLVAEIAKRGVGEKIRIKPLVAAVLKDDRIVDANIALAQKNDGAAGANADFEPAQNAAVQLDPANVTFEPPHFDQPLPAGQTVAVDVSAKITVLLQSGVSAEQARALLTTKLKTAFASVPADTSIDVDFLLNALRDDANYSIDPMKLQVTLTSAQQFVQITQGSASLRVLATHRFEVKNVEVNA